MATKKKQKPKAKVEPETDTEVTTEPEVSVSLPEKAKKEKRLRLKKPSRMVTIILTTLGSVFALLLFFSYLVYGAKSEGGFIKGVTKIIPYPVLEANGRFVGYYDFLFRLDAQKYFYREVDKKDLNSEEGKSIIATERKKIIDELTEGAIISVEAKKMNIKVSQKDIDDSFDKLVVSSGGRDDFPLILKKNFGLSVKEYKSKIYATQVLREKVKKAINDDEAITGAAKKKADELYQKLKAGADFAKLARDNSQDAPSAANGGDVGFFKNDRTKLPEFEDKAFSMKVGEISEPFRTVQGYHIIKVTDKKDGQVRASQILIRVRDYNSWLTEKKTELQKKKFWGAFPGIWYIYKL